MNINIQYIYTSTIHIEHVTMYLLYMLRSTYCTCYNVQIVHVTKYILYMLQCTNCTWYNVQIVHITMLKIVHVTMYKLYMLQCTYCTLQCGQFMTSDSCVGTGPSLVPTIYPSSSTSGQSMIQMPRLAQSWTKDLIFFSL